MGNYGKELILDLHECEVATFTKENIKKYFDELCKLIDMEQCDLHWWEEEFKIGEKNEPHIIGISAIQFIRTSNIVIHSLEIMKKAYINIFSCKDFDEKTAAEFSKNWFKGKIVNKKTIKRI